MKRTVLLILAMCFACTAFADNLGVRLLNATKHELMFNNKDMQITYTICEKSFPPKNCGAEQIVLIKGGSVVVIPKPNVPHLVDVLLYVKKAVEFDYARAEVAKGEYPFDDNPIYGSFDQNDIIIFNDYNTNLIIASKGRA